MAQITIGSYTPTRSIGALAGAAEDVATRRSISRQVKGVVIATLLLVAVFLVATANAVITIDQSSTAADRARAETAVSLALADGTNASNTLVRELGDTYQLQGARLTQPSGVMPDETAIPLTDGYVMAFTPRALGTETFRSIAPIRITAALLLVIFIALVLNRLHALARHIDTQRIAARKLATLDPLTGLSNRLHFNEQLDTHLDAAAAGSRSALLMLDLDGFKAVNDRHGHLAGDRLLQEVAQRLKAHAGPKDVVARLGGDEFAIIRQGAVTRHELTEFADGLVSLMRAPCEIEGARLCITMSVGIAKIEHETLEAEALIRAADAALYRAKMRSGGGYELAGTAPRRTMTVVEPAAA